MKATIFSIFLIFSIAGELGNRGEEMQKYNKELTPVLYGPSAVKILHYDIAPNKGCFRTHWHDRMEILRVQRGEIFVGYDTTIRKVREGEVLIIPPHTPHKGFAGDDPLAYDVFMFDIRSFYNETEICQTCFPAVYDGRAKFRTITDEPEIVECLDKIRDTEGAVKNPLEVTADVYRFLYLMFKHCLLEIDQDIHTNKKWKEIVKYMEENCAQDLTTAMLSARYNYSEEHFCRKFKAATGLTPMKYLKIFRVEKGYQMIKEGERDVSKIAGLCGFGDANYFTRCFKAHFGVPPSHFVRAGK